jgi:hypothetical protein
MEDFPEPPGVLAGLTHEERIDEFFRLLSEGAKVKPAANAVHISWSGLYARRREDPAFAKRWEDAKRITVTHLEDEAFRRAMNGSDKLMEVLLKAHAPEKYRERQEVTHKGGMSFNVFTGMPTDDVDDLV